MKCKSFKTRITRSKVLLFVSFLLLIFSQTADLSFAYTITILEEQVTNYIQVSYYQRVGDDPDNFVFHTEESTHIPFAYLNNVSGFTGATFNSSGFSILSYLEGTDNYLGCFEPNCIYSLGGYGAKTEVSITYKVTGGIGETGPVDVLLDYDFLVDSAAAYADLMGAFSPGYGAPASGELILPSNLGVVYSIDAYVRSSWYDVGSSAQLDVNITVVPEPATMLLLGSGLIGLAGYGRKKFFKK